MSTDNLESGERLLASRQRAATMLDCSVQHIDDLCSAGKLEKVRLGPNRVGIKMPSILKLASGGK